MLAPSPTLRLPIESTDRRVAALSRLGRLAAALVRLDLGLVVRSSPDGPPLTGVEASVFAALPRPFTPAGLLEVNPPAGRYRGLSAAGWKFMAAHPIADSDGLVAGALVVLGRDERTALSPDEASVLAGLAGLAGDLLAGASLPPLTPSDEPGNAIDGLEAAEAAQLPGLALTVIGGQVRSARGAGLPGVPLEAIELVGQPLAAVFDGPAGEPVVAGGLPDGETFSFTTSLRGQAVQVHARRRDEVTRLLVAPALPAAADSGLRQAVLDHSPVGYALLGMDGRVQWANLTLRDWLGWSEALAGGQRLVEFPNGFSGASDWPEFLQLVAGRRSEYSVSREYERADGSRFPATVTVRLVPGENGAQDLILQTVQPTPAAPEQPEGAASLVDAQRQAVNEERLRIARELHDGLGKDLYGLALLLEAVSERQKGRAVARELVDYADLTRKLANQGRALLRTFRDPDATPLVKRLQAIALSFEEQGGPRLSLEASGLPELTSGAAFELERIVQEALSNVRKHAEASNVSVSLTNRPDALLLEVRDDGRGLPVAPPGMDDGHFGLVGMRERANLLGGHLSVTSLPEGGTLIRGIFPIQALREAPDGR